MAGAVFGGLGSSLFVAGATYVAKWDRPLSFSLQTSGSAHETRNTKGNKTKQPVVVSLPSFIVTFWELTMQLVLTRQANE